MRSRFRTLVAVGITLTLMAVTAVTAAAQVGEGDGPMPVDGGVYLFRNVSDGRYLDADQANENFNVNTSSDPKADDEWSLIAEGDAGVFLIRNQDTGRYLDGDGADKGFNVDQSVEPSFDDQWRFEPAGDGSWFIISVSLGRYLDVDGPDRGFNVETSAVPSLDDQWELIRLDEPEPTPTPTPTPAPTPAPVDGSAPVYSISFSNITEGQYLTPPNVVAHSTNADVFEVGAAASPGVQAVAENGGVGVLAAELREAVDANGLGNSTVGNGPDGPIGPGETRVFELTSDAEVLSLVSMVICTNDGFAGLDSVDLPTLNEEAVGYLASAYDAGTEVNTEMRADLVPAPFCGEGPGSGVSNPELAEGGVITAHPTLTGSGDLDPALDWDGPVAEIIITRHDPIPSYTVVVENVTTGQYFTPPNYAVHSASADLFQLGEPASGPLQQLAENGAVAGVADYLHEIIDSPRDGATAGLGTSGVGRGEQGPIGPGESRTFTIRGSEDRFSLVSMIICTNDGFAGIDSQELPGGEGEQVEFLVAGYDAGTEENTEDRADLVPAGFCGPGEGTGASNPSLAENGIIRPHQTLRNTGNLNPALDWDGPVLRVTIEHNNDEGTIITANRASGDLSVIDADTLNVERQDIGSTEEAAVDPAVDPMYVNHWRLGGKVFVGDRAGDQVLVLDDESLAVVERIPVGAGVFHQWIEPSGSQLWVVGDVANTLTVIDPHALEVMATIDIPGDITEAGGKPHDVFVSGSRAFTTIIGIEGGLVLEYSTTTFELVSRTEVAGDPHLFVSGGTVYVPQQDGSLVSIVEGGETIANLSVPNAHGIWVPSSGQVLVTNIAEGGTAGVQLLDAALTQVIETVDLEVPAPHNLTVNSSESRVFVTHSGAAGNQVSVIDYGSDGLGNVTRREVGVNPFGLGLVR